MRHSASSLYKDLREKGLVDFGREKFERFLYESGLGRVVRKGMRVYVEVEDRNIPEIEDLLKRWKEALTPGEIKEKLESAGINLSRASLYRYLRKLPSDVVVDINGLGRRYSERALYHLFTMIRYGEGIFKKESVARIPYLPEILEFVLRRSGAEKALLCVVASEYLPFKEKTVLIGSGEKRVVVFIPSVTEGDGLRVAFLEEPLTQKVLEFKGQPTFTSIYLGVRKENTAIIIEKQKPLISKAYEALTSREELFRMVCPDGLRPVEPALGLSEPGDLYTEVFFFSDETGELKKVANYNSLFVKIAENMKVSD